MREPKRLLSEGATDFERQLLKAVMNERPSSMMRSRMQQGLGLAGPILWAGNAKALLSSIATKSGFASALGGLVAAGGLAAAVGLGSVDSSSVDSPSNSSPSGADRAVAVPVVAAPVAPEASTPIVAVDELSEIERNSQLREEIAVLDVARIALQQGQRARALEVLARYGERFPGGILSREANLLQRQAVSRAQRAGARRSAARGD
jgi:hypothetical protein